jgi:glucose/arabinose dehydrogenase
MEQASGHGHVRRNAPPIPMNPRTSKPLRFLFLAALILGAAAGAAILPAGFAETRIAGGLNPVTMSFAPDGRLFLCEKHGLLRVVKDGKLLEKPFLDLTRKVDAWNERGLLSVCFDPEFARQRLGVCLLHPQSRPEGRHSRQSSNNRVSRFTARGRRPGGG